MPVDLTKTLRQALAKLESEKQRIDRQVSMIRSVLGSADGRGAVRSRPRRRMGPAARKAVSQRMKAYWAAKRAKAKASKTKKAS